MGYTDLILFLLKVHDATTFISDLSFIWFVYTNFQIKEFSFSEVFEQNKIWWFFINVISSRAFFFSWGCTPRVGLFMLRIRSEEECCPKICEQYFCTAPANESLNFYLSRVDFICRWCPYVDTCVLYNKWCTMYFKHVWIFILFLILMLCLCTKSGPLWPCTLIKNSY